MKVVIAHDFVRHGGAEKVLEQLHVMWPNATIYTLLSEDPPQYKDWDIRSSWLQGKVPPKRYRWPLPLFPGMVDRLAHKIDWRGVDLLISSSVSFMKNLQAPEGIPHLCYIHRPAMFAYEREEMFLSGYPAVARPFLSLVTKRFRAWDQKHSDAPSLYVANSSYVADMVQEVYGKSAHVTYPPVNLEPFRAAAVCVDPGDYYFTALRLEGYKRVDLLIDACKQMDVRLKIAGTGPMMDTLRAQAGPKVEFLGFVSDEEMYTTMAGCRAFIFPSEEDFGIAPVEAMAAGRPVIALGKGGPLETVIDGQTGVHFQSQTIADLVAAIQRVESISWDPIRIQQSAERFSEETFRKSILALADELVAR